MMWAKMHFGVAVIVCAVFVSLSQGERNYDYFSESSSYGDTTERTNPNPHPCRDIRPQYSVDVEHILGEWHGVEIYMHTHDMPGVYTYDTCVLIHLTDITQQMQNVYGQSYDSHRWPASTSTRFQQQEDQLQRNEYVDTRYLRLVWTEKDDNLEYTFNYTTLSPGLWKNVGEQRGSWVTRNKYRQFSGSVQVVKAVNDHLVLTFCGSDENSSVYTIVASRGPPGLRLEDMRSIRKLLARRGLDTSAVRKVCASGAQSLWSTSLLTILLGSLVVLGKWQ